MTCYCYGCQSAMLMREVDSLCTVDTFGLYGSHPSQLPDMLTWDRVIQVQGIDRGEALGLLLHAW